MTINPIYGSASLLRVGTIVSFAFPLREGEGRAKWRPCLVVATGCGNEGEPRVTIAYGTSAATQANRGADLALCDPEDWRSAGLRRQSRFVLARRVTVPLSDLDLGGRRAGSPVIGVLPPSAMVTLRQLTRALGARITTDSRRGSVGIRAGGRHGPQQHGRREPVIIRVARRRFERPAARMGEQHGQRMAAAPTLRTTLRLAAARR